MKPYPNCLKCDRSPLVHALIGARLACAWDGGTVQVEADFGRATPIIVADVYRTLGKTTPKAVVDRVLALRKEGITSWT